MYNQKDIDNLLDIIDYIEKIEKFVEGIPDADIFFQNELVFDAVLMNFINIGESIGRLSGEIMAKHEEVPWQRVRSFRNIIAHDYLGIDAEEIWQILKNRLPKFKKDVESVLKMKKG